MNEAGKIARAQVARTLTEAEVLAGRLQDELTRRSAHPEAVRYCTAELLAQDNFHAALEAVKGIADRIRGATGVDADGAELVQRVFSLKRGRPLIAVNGLQTESERSEQAGFSNLVTGLFGLYRNPTAHDPRIERDATRPIGEVELLELLTTVSLVHHVLDRAIS